MSFDSWILLVAGVLLGMGLMASYVVSLPFTPTMVYLAVGVALGPAGWAVIHLDPNFRVELFHRCAEVAVVISLFTVGMKLRLPWRDRRWRAPLVLAFASMAVTVGLIAGVGVWMLNLPWGAAILLGALDRYRLDRLRVAAGGLREGLILAAAHGGSSWRAGLRDLARGWDR